MSSINETRENLLLIVDDDPGIRMLLRASMENAGYQVVEANDGVQAIEQFMRHKPAAILMDVDMPEIDGYEACARIRQDQAGLHVPIIMVTGMEDVDSVNRAYSAGATDFITKPINWDLLGYRVRYVLRSSRTFSELRTSEAKNDALLKAIPDTFFIVHQSGTIRDYIPGIDAGHLLEPRGDQQNIFDYFPARIAEEWHDQIADVAANKTASHFELKLGDGEDERHYELEIVPYLKNLTLTSFRDITERKKAEEKIHNLAYYDPLTGLPNRQRFHQQLELAIETAKKNDLKVAALYVDLDDFKRINDTLGHNYGDVVLQVASKRMARCVRDEDMVGRAETSTATMLKEPNLARLGGDEFVAILQNLRTEDEALVVAERIRDELMQPVQHEGQELVVTSSIGVAIYPDDGEDSESLLKNADMAMYQSKAAGRNSVRFYSGTMSIRSLERLSLEMSLRNALENDEFELYYQPKVSVETKCWVGFEALLRWQHPEEGFIDPKRFIPLAEETGLIEPLGKWALRQACNQTRKWVDKFGDNFTMGVNISSHQFLQSNDVADEILQELSRLSLSPRMLQVEVTESLMMDERVKAVAMISKLRDAGVTIAMDDFGTGKSSLGSLQSFPLDVLKIDSSFVQGLESDEGKAIVCKTIIEMGHNLGLRVNAEGVEMTEQFEFLREHHCDEVQGYLFCGPVPAQKLEAMLEAQQTETTDSEPAHSE
jgi:predicted signal transduction protein with EAL and GGDEF domain/ActR/RegA family two-component response regulator